VGGCFLRNQLHRPADWDLNSAIIAVDIFVVVQLLVFLRMKVLQVLCDGYRHFFVFGLLSQMVKIGLDAENNYNQSNNARDSESGDQERMGFRPVEIGFRFGRFRAAVAW
jgi:hypothetical protein